MNYVKDPIKLGNVMKTLAEHDSDVTQYFLAELRPRVTVDDRNDRLTKLFVLANAERQGTGKDNNKLVQATKAFITEKLNEMELGKTHEDFLVSLCRIKGMKQKTANLFLKWVVTYQNEFELNLGWDSWKPFLHVPLDRWVLRLIGKDYLNVCESNFEDDFKKNKSDYDIPKITEKKYGQLQDDIRGVASSVNQPPITLDTLWFVGSKYCRYHPLLCDICWLGQYCVRHEKIDWPNVSIQSTYNEKMDFVRKTFRIWKSENPGKTDNDFSKFLETQKGKQWLNKFLNPS